jgi:hypothetical protein
MIQVLTQGSDTGMLIVDVGNGVVYVAAVTMSQEQHRNLLHQM